MPPADAGYQDGDYGSDLVTNPDSDTFKPIASQAPNEKTDKTVPVASQTRNIATRRDKVLPTPRVTKVNRKSPNRTQRDPNNHTPFSQITSFFRAHPIPPNLPAEPNPPGTNREDNDGPTQIWELSFTVPASLSAGIVLKIKNLQEGDEYEGTFDKNSWLGWSNNRTAQLHYEESQLFTP